MMENMFNGICGRIAPGCCRLGYNGGIAVKTSSGKYKIYNMKTGNLTNCEKFVMDIADDLFMVMPTRKLKPGDIVLFNGRPKCIIENNGKTVGAVNYDDGTIETIIPERHLFLGKQFYGKIVSLIGNGFGRTKGGFFKNMLKFKMMSAMLGGKTDTDGMFGGSGNALPMMMLMGAGGMDGMFDGMLEGDEDDENDETPFNLFGDDAEDDEEDEVVEVKKVAKKTAKKVRK